MYAFNRLLPRLRYYFFRAPLFRRVFITNSIIIIVGAICGTVLTRQLTLVGNLNLILLFASLGIALTVLVNYLVLRTVIRPLRELGQVLDKVQEDQIKLPETMPMQTDPEIHRLVLAIDSMLLRLDRRTRQLRALSERVINVQEEERRRIARALHDDTAQAISTVIIQLERLESALPLELPDLENRLAQARRLATSTLEDLRKNIWNLRPSILDDLGLIPAIRWYARSMLEESGTQVQLGTSGEVVRLSPHLETTLFRVAQEAVNNILRHAGAQKVDIRLLYEPSEVCLEIFDNGRGFDVEQTSGEAVSHKQLGLLGIRERVSLVNGEVEIISSPGRGALLRICVPILKNGSLSKVEEEEKMLQTRLP